MANLKLNPFSILLCGRTSISIEQIDIVCDQPSDIFDPTPASIVSVLVTFYRNKGGLELKQRLTVHVLSRKNHDSAETQNNDLNNNNKEIKTLWIQFCSPGSTN